MSKAREAKKRENWLQVRLKRETAARLKAFAAKLDRLHAEGRNDQPAFLDELADYPCSFDRAVMALLWREDNHAMRSRKPPKAALDRKSARK
jgi:hypothetical protein